MVDSLMYVCSSRSCISFNVGLFSRFMQEPKYFQIQAGKITLIYLTTTSDYGVSFPKPARPEQDKLTVKLMGYCDLDWCGDKVEMNSTMRHMFNFFNSQFSWCSKKQMNLVIIFVEWNEDFQGRGEAYGWQICY